LSIIRRLHASLLAPEDVIRHLGAPHHWKEGRSAKSLVDQWWSANALPPSICDILGQADDWVGAELIDAFVERSTSLADGRPSHSQSDLMAIVGISDRLGILTIEAKVDEGFDQTVAEWLARDSPGKRARLAGLCALMGLEESAVSTLRYQLLHRTASAVLEAKRYRARQAAMIVQSWSYADCGWLDYQFFFNALGLRGLAVGRLSAPLLIDGIVLRTAWSNEWRPDRA